MTGLEVTAAEQEIISINAKLLGFSAFGNNGAIKYPPNMGKAMLEANIRSNGVKKFLPNEIFILKPAVNIRRINPIQEKAERIIDCSSNEKNMQENNSGKKYPKIVWPNIMPDSISPITFGSPSFKKTPPKIIDAPQINVNDNSKIDNCEGFILLN